MMPQNFFLEVGMAQGKRRLVRLAESMENCATPDVSAIKKCSELWEDFGKVVGEFKHGTHLKAMVPPPHKKTVVHSIL